MSDSFNLRSLLFIISVLSLFLEVNKLHAEDKQSPIRQRRVLYNFDGDSCMFRRTGVIGPVKLTIQDLKNHVKEISFAGSQVDTMLLCVNAQTMYYPTKVGTMRGTLSTPEERRNWKPNPKQHFENVAAFFAQGDDPYAVMLSEARDRGLEALLSFRMNDAHENDIFRTQFWQDHPEFRLNEGASLNFDHDEVREYIFRLIEEAVQRYDSDGLELDFNRFPEFFQDLSQQERITKMNALVKRVRNLLDKEGQKRERQLVLGVRVPSNRGLEAPSYESSLALGCDPAAWAKQGWIDFLVVSEFLVHRYDLPIAPWKKHIHNVPIYGGIECFEMRKEGRFHLSAENYRTAANHLWRDGADGIYLFNFFVTRDYRKVKVPPFEVLGDLANQK